MNLINLRTQVQKVMRLINGGTGNTQGWSRGVIKVCTNRTGSTIPLYSLVRLTFDYNDGRVEPTDTSGEVDVLGIVVGYWPITGATDTLIYDDAPSPSTVAVLTSGTSPVLIAATVTRGQYAFASSTAGQARSSATAGAGAFGIFQGSGTAGNTAIVTLSGWTDTASGGASFGTPAIVLGTAAAPGAATTAVRTDATLLAFDATTPAAVSLGGSGAVGAATVAARRDHAHAVTGALDALSDVAAPSPTTGDVLTWNGSAWVDSPPAVDPNVWRPIMAYDGTDWWVLTGVDGTAIMAYGPP